MSPGRGPAACRFSLEDLDAEESWARLDTHGVGRVAVTTAGGPAIVPVNYSVVDGTIVFRTAPGALPSATASRQAAFEVDRIDEALRQGWSVLVVGPGEEVVAPEEARRLVERAASRQLWVRITSDRVTGRRSHAEG